MINDQNQKGGDGSTNIQAQQIIFNTGIDEKRAREIYQEMNSKLREFYSQEAMAIAKSRLEDFENKLVRKMDQVNGAMRAFADPGFQLLLVQAQKAAAATERPVDHDLLSELLLHRFNSGENRNTRTGISLAVDIVDKISDEGLLGLTAVHAVNNLLPSTGNINEWLDILDNFFGRIMCGDSQLPIGTDWIEHLDILNAIRIDQLISFRPLSEYYSEKFPGLIDVGIPKDSENYRKAIALLENNNIPTDIFIEHTLDRRFFRLCITEINQIEEIILQRRRTDNTIISEDKLSSAQKAAMKEIYALYSKNNTERTKNISSFMKEWKKRSNLDKLDDWWKTIAIGFNITSAGTVLAHSNAQRCDQNIPSLK